MKEIDLSKFVRKVPIEDTVVFNNNPTEDDVKKASKEGKMIFSNNPSDKTVFEIHLLPCCLKCFVSFFHADLTDDEFKKYILDALKNHEASLKDFMKMNIDIMSEPFVVRVPEDETNG